MRDICNNSKMFLSKFPVTLLRAVAEGKFVTK
jgi:hypothetical protein